MEVPLRTSFHGYPTCFDVPSNSWKPLCEGACTVDVHTTPPTIYLEALDGTVLKAIPLTPTFVHFMQSAAAVMVRTSSDNTAAMYGFGFGGPDTGSLFEEALKRVQQSLKQTPTPQQPSPVVDRGTSLTTGVEETNVFKKRFPLQGGQQARNTEGEVDRVNDTIKKIKINTVETPDEPQVPYHEQVDLCTSLAKAIATGDILESQKLVRALIEKKMKAKATVLCEEKMCKFNINIHVESVNMEPTEPISLLVTDPLTTCIRNLKEEMYKKYHIPVAIQRFIIRDRLTRDTDTLAFCGVTPESAVKIYLYLKPLDECFTSHDAQTRDEEFLEETPVLNQHLPFTGAQQLFHSPPRVPSTNEFPPRDPPISLQNLPLEFLPPSKRHIPEYQENLARMFGPPLTQPNNNIGGLPQGIMNTSMIGGHNMMGSHNAIPPLGGHPPVFPDLSQREFPPQPAFTPLPPLPPYSGPAVEMPDLMPMLSSNDSNNSSVN